jgi:hypothetical protein
VTNTDILFKEYDTLRAEILERQRGAFQLTLIAGAAFAWFATHMIDSWSKYGRTGKTIWVIGGLILLAFFARLANQAMHDAKQISKRLIEIEKKINKIAGEKLLEWETEWSWTAKGWSSLLRVR